MTKLEDRLAPNPRLQPILRVEEVGVHVGGQLHGDTSAGHHQRDIRLAMPSLLSLLLLSACAHVPDPHHGPAWPEARADLRREGLAVAPVGFVADLDRTPLPELSASGAVQALLEQDDPGPVPTVLDPHADRDAAFLRNHWVGNVRFGGGIIRTGDIGVEVRARLVELGQDAPYRAQSAAWLSAAVDDALLDRRIDAVRAAAVDAPAPIVKPFRGRHPEDGHDNVNVPRTLVTPAPLSAEGLAAATSAAKGHRWLMIPLVRTYLSHNAGWFLGQHWGCMSGARAEAVIAVYDLHSGEPVWWLATEAVWFERTGSPSRSDLDAYLLGVEEETARILARRLLR
jgi:hypothetical protein